MIDVQLLYCLQVDLTRKRLERAGKLTSGLADEGVRWQATADQLQTQTELLVGDVFLSAACIAYYGAFTGSYRCEWPPRGWHAFYVCWVLLQAGAQHAMRW